MNVYLRLLTVMVVLSFVSIGRADTITLSATEDTTIYSNLVNNSGGGHNFGIAGQASNGNDRRFLLRFDLTGIAPGSTVTSAQLDLDILQVGNSGGSFELFRIDTDWGEGTQTGNQGNAAGAGDATWNEAEFGSVDWTPGGSFFDPVLSNVQVSSTGISSFNSSANFTSAIQAIVDDPTQNFGFLISSPDTNSAVRIGSREGASAPQLSVEFTAVPEPTTLPILLFGMAGLSFFRSKK